MIKLGGFILAAQLEHSCSRRNTACGTSMYMAPEVYDGNTCLKSDIWSLGISIIEMAENKNPFAEDTPIQVMEKVCFKEPPSFTSSSWSSDLRDFVKRCLQMDVDERASVNDLLKVRVTSRSNE